MKAAILRKFGPIERNPLEFADVSIPEPAAGELSIRVGVCGVCHTDLHTAEGELPEVGLPIIPGHQAVGIVEKTGEGCARFKKGERIGAAWLRSACGACRFCLGGQENLCVAGRFSGYHADGGYAEYMTVPEKFAYTIPGTFSDEEAAPLLCAGIIGYRALRLSGIKAGGTLGLYGFGASAHIAIQVAVHWGAKVFVFSRSRAHQELARCFGAVWAGSAQDTPPSKMSGSIIFAPAGDLVSLALANTERGGTVALAGIYMTPIPELDHRKHLDQERILRSVANATRRDGEELLKIAEEIPIKTMVQVFALEDANIALRRLKEGRITGAAVLKINS